MLYLLKSNIHVFFKSQILRYIFQSYRKVMDTIIIELNNIYFFVYIHYSPKVGTKFLKLGSNGEISIIHVGANSISHVQYLFQES